MKYVSGRGFCVTMLWHGSYQWIISEDGLSTSIPPARSRCAKTREFELSAGCRSFPYRNNQLGTVGPIRESNATHTQNLSSNKWFQEHLIWRLVTESFPSTRIENILDIGNALIIDQIEVSAFFITSPNEATGILFQPSWP